MVDPAFFGHPEPVTMADLAALAGCDLPDDVDGSAVIAGISPLKAPVRGTVTFAEGKAAASRLAEISDVIVLTTEALTSSVPSGVVALVTKQPFPAFVSLAERLYPTSTPRYGFDGCQPGPNGSHVHPTARIEDGVLLAPGSAIGADCEIGAGTSIGPNTTISAGCKVGRGSAIGSNVAIQCAYLGDRVRIHSGAAIGQDGFGFMPGANGIRKVPQLGRVIIQNDVEIGANTTIDRGALEDTVIGEGTKIDNLVQIAHNVVIGRMCLIAGQVGIAGSSSVGDGTMIGGNAGISDHVHVGRGVQLAARSGAISDIPDGARYSGAPAKPARQHFREIAAIQALVTKRSKQPGE